MFIHHLSTALRIFNHYKLNSALNVLGLSIGLGAAILVGLFAHYEQSFDLHQPDHQRVYRLQVDVNVPGLKEVPLTQISVAQTLTERADVESLFYLTDVIDSDYMSDQVKVDGKILRLRNIYGASDNILQFIKLNILHGDIATALSLPNHMALSRSEATRLFGKTPALGKQLDIDDERFTVSAVFADLPNNSHFLFHNLVSLDLAKPEYQGSSYIYAKVHKNADIEGIEQQLAQTLNRQFNIKNSQLFYRLVLMKDIYFNAHSPFELKPGGSPLLVTLSLVLCVLLVAIALANYINLVVSQLLLRVKELAIRKSLGASQWQLISQFLLEAWLMMVFAALLSVCWVELLAPALGDLSGRPIELYWQSQTMLLFVSAVLVLGSLAGMYPAYLVARAPLKMLLQGCLANSGLIRKALLIFQSAMAVTLIAGCILCLQQLALLQSLPVGYQSQGRVVVKNLSSAQMMVKAHPILDQIRKLNGVVQVTTTDTDLTDSFMESFYFRWPNGYEESHFLPTIGTGFNAVDSLGLTLVSGRDFSPKYQSDWLHFTTANKTDDAPQAMAIMVTENMAKRAGYQNPNKVVGLTLTSVYSNVTATIVGVVNDLKLGSAKDEWLPLSFSCGYSSQSRVDLVINTHLPAIHALYSPLSNLLAEFKLTTEPEFSLMTEDQANMYRIEQTIMQLLYYFALLAIVLSCLGLFGLASFSTTRRQKEVAMRKVLGASRISIINLLSKEFLGLVLISIAFAFPLTYWLVGDWLAGFNERLEQSAWVYLLAALVVAAITWLTVASLAFKAASTRPSLILRDE